MQLRGYQREAINSIYTYFNNESGHPLLVLPTAAGKGVIQAFFQREVLHSWPDQRILSLTHVKELIEQNYSKVVEVWPEADAGIYCAALKRRDRFNPMVFGSIQSVHKKADALGRFDLIIVDEAHLVPMNDDTMYRRFLDDCLRINPNLKVIGMSATPFRLDSGFLHTGEDALFTDICYNLPITRLIQEGFLTPLISKSGVEKMDTTSMRTVRGDFKPSDMIDEAKRVMAGACAEIVDYGQTRSSWLLFCPGVEYAVEVHEHLRDTYGLLGAVLHGGTPKDQREAILRDFKSGRLKYVTNCDILTTGFDAPIIDMIAFLRPTQSPALYIQMCGRGMRLSPETGKLDCLVLDFAGNVNRHGPVDTINIVDKITGEKGEVELEGAAPTKDCPECNSIVAVQTRICPFCSYVWPAKHDVTAQTQEIISTLEKPNWHDVSEVAYFRHTKADKPDSVRVDYRCGMQFYSEWVCPDHEGYAKTSATKWLVAHNVDRYSAEMASTDQMLTDAAFFPQPGRILLRRDGKYQRVIDYDFETQVQALPETVVTDLEDFSDDIPF